MRIPHARPFSRRRFLGQVTLAGTAGLLGVHPRPSAAEPPPETTTLRLLRTPSICEAPAQVAGDLLLGEGFSDVQFVKVSASLDGYKALVAGEVSMGLLFSGGLVTRIDAGDPLVLLAGADHRPRRHPRRLLRAVRQCARAQRAGPQGQDRGRAGVGKQPAHFCGEYGDIRGPGSADRYSLGDPSLA
jgi:hypothetical protein